MPYHLATPAISSFSFFESNPHERGKDLHLESQLNHKFSKEALEARLIKKGSLHGLPSLATVSLFYFRLEVKISSFRESKRQSLARTRATTARSRHAKRFERLRSWS